MFMPKLGTTHRRNRVSSRVAAALCLAITIALSPLAVNQKAAGQASSVPASGNQPANSAQQPASATPPSQAPAQGQPQPQAAPTQPPNQTGTPGQAPADQPTQNGVPAGQPMSGDQGQAAANDNGTFTFKAEAREVVLHATVVDDRNHLVMNLDKPDFTVYENDKPQQISSFKQQDFPVAMGIVIDNSGSMREKRDQVNKAAINLVRSSNPDDEVFVVNFNDEYYLDQDFTSDVKKLQGALEHVETRGGTALYDAIIASADYLMKSKLSRKVIFVVT